MSPLVEISMALVESDFRIVYIWMLPDDINPLAVSGPDPYHYAIPFRVRCPRGSRWIGLSIAILHFMGGVRTLAGDDTHPAAGTPPRLQSFSYRLTEDGVIGVLVVSRHLASVFGTVAERAASNEDGYSSFEGRAVTFWPHGAREGWDEASLDDLVTNARYCRILSPNISLGVYFRAGT